MSEMADRVARALCAADQVQSCEGDSRCINGDQCPYPVLARAAIEAMREPTEAMIDAAYFPAGESGDSSVSRADAKETWRSMISAALDDTADTYAAARSGRRKIR